MSWGNPKSTIDNLRTMLFMPFTIPYQFGLNLHQLVYKEKWLTTGKLSQPVISIGNLTIGGTGKTPMIIDLASQLIANNIKVGILSRGYKRSKGRPCTIVSDGQGTFAPLEEAGDEALMIAKILPKAVVVVDSNRFAAGKKAISEYNCQAILLDDGYQHWPLKRDYDMVLLNYADEPWHDVLLPSGRLREPLSALDRASHIIITKVPDKYDQTKLDRLQELARHYSPQAKISTCQFKAVSVYQLLEKQWTIGPINRLKGLPVVAFCGIAKPDEFFDLVKQLGANIRDQIYFPDHHHYSKHDQKKLAAKLKQTGASYLITTRKDLIKLDSSSLAPSLMSINLQTNWLDIAPDIVSLTKIPVAQGHKL